jgi:hypothetical protein
MMLKLLLALASATLLGPSGCAGMKDQAATTPARAPAAEAPASILQASTTRPRYIAEAIRMRADDETGVDILGSDEVIGVFESQGHGMVTGIYGDMDTGDTAQFRTSQRCLWGAIDPDGQFNHTWACDPVGSAGPIAFTVTLYEYDGPVRAFLTNWEFCLSGGDLGAAGCQVSPDSTVIGRYRISFSETDLVGAMSAPGDTYTNSFVIDGCSDLVSQGGACAGPSWGTYTFTFQITRTADEVEQAPRPAPHR